MSKARWSVVAACLLLVVSLAASPQTNGPVQYVYDELGRLVAAIDANGNAAIYQYDAVGNILSISRVASTQVSVISFTPSHGPQGASVTIYGTGFSATASQDAVTFNGVSASVISASSNQLVVTVPTGATTGPISVASPAGSATSSSSFTVMSGGPPTITGFTPPIAAAGTAVTINGTNFDPSPVNNRLGFNTNPALPTGTTATTISTTLPSNATSGHITVATQLGTATSSQDLFVPFGTHVTADVAYTGRTTLGGSATVTLSTAGKIGLLLFDANAGQRLDLQWTSTIASCGLYVFAPNGSQIATNYCSATSGGVDNTLLPWSGTYTVGIEAVSASGSLTLNLTDVSDASGTIVIDGPPVTATTTKAGQDARLIFSASAEQRVALQVTSVPSGQYAILYLLGITGETLTSISITPTAPGQVIFMDTQPLIATGRYTLWIKHSGTNVGSETLQLASVPADATATLTVPAAGATGPTGTLTTTKAGQNGSFTFSGTLGQRLSLNVTSASYASCGATLYDPSSNSVSVFSCSAVGTSSPVTLAATGTYSIFVNPSGTNTGSVTMSINNDSDVTGTIAIDGSAVTTTTTVNGQDARLSFTGTANQRIVVYATNVSNPLATVYLVKPDGTNQTYFGINNNPAGQTFFLDTQTLATAGTYQLWVQHIGTGAGSETLQMASVPADVTATLTVPSAGTGPTASLTISKAGQDGTFTFSGTTGQKLSFNLPSSTLGTGFTKGNCTLKDPNNTSVTNWYCGAGASNFVPTVTLGATGTYTIYVDAVGMATGSVTMSINNDSDVTGTITIDGSAVTTTTTVAGQDARLSFTGTANQRIVVYATNVSNPSATVYLVKPDGTNQTSFGINNSPAGQTFFLDTQTLATAGTYQLWVQHSGTGVGSEILQIASVPADVTGTVTVGGAAVGVPTTGNTAVGQNASLTFSGTAGQQVTINVTSPTFGASSTSCSLTVKDPSNNTVTSGYCGTGASATIGPFTTNTAGTYTIFINPQGTATGRVTISLVTP